MASSNRSGKGGTGASAPPEDLIARLGLPVDARLIDRALTHRSYAYENGGLPTNERLEFLGDSVLGLVVTDTLYTTHSELPEGQLAKLRSAVVNSKALAEVARGLRLGDYVKLGRGEETTGGRDKASILADTLEALIGSVYLDHGIEVAFDLVKRLFGPLIATSATLGAGLDWKTSLQELTAVAGIGVPDYRVTETGPDHDKFFEADACVGGITYGHGSGRSKKEAEQQAAEQAWRTIRETHAETLAAKGVLPGAAGDRKLTHGPYDIDPEPGDPAAEAS